MTIRFSRAKVALPRNKADERQSRAPAGGEAFWHGRENGEGCKQTVRGETARAR